MGDVMTTVGGSRTVRHALVLACTMGAIGCDKGSETGAAASGSAAGSSAPAAAAGCPAGDAKYDKLGICLTLPPDCELGDGQDPPGGHRVGFKAPKSGSTFETCGAALQIESSTDASQTPDKQIENAERMAQTPGGTYKVVEKGDLPAGKGKFILMDEGSFFRFTAVAPLAKGIVSCAFTYDKGKEAKKAVDICKSLKVYAATATASAPAAGGSGCPDGSSGAGTAQEPCTAKGSARLMRVKWTGKNDPPTFDVTNDAKRDIIHADIRVYFYDKDGKQLEVKGLLGMPPDKTFPTWWSSGWIFSGKPVKAGATQQVSFPSLKAEIVPAGTDAVEAEIDKVAFAGADGNSMDTWWQNKDLGPDARTKGGVQ